MSKKPPPQVLTQGCDRRRPSTWRVIQAPIAALADTHQRAQVVRRCRGEEPPGPMPQRLVEVLLAAAIEAVEAVPDNPCDSIEPDALTAFASSLERLRRQVEELATEVADHVDATKPFRADGVFTAKSWLQHRLQLSGPEAHRRVQTARMHRELPEWASAARSGVVGVAQSQLMAQVAANPRIPPDVLHRDAPELLGDAVTEPFAVFERRLRIWESLADPVGSLAHADRIQANRNAMCRPRPSGGWELSATLDGVSGAEFNEILAHFIEVEWRADWAAARERLGDATTTSDLARTEPQRRADALVAMARAAAVAPVDRSRPVPTVNILIDQPTFEATLKGERIDPARFRDVVCRTRSGQQLHTSEVVRTALWGHIRRVVYDADSVVIDLGRRSRAFTGSAREAAMLLTECCNWPACDTPVDWCDVDHSISWAAHGATVPRNGSPLCHRHNLMKERGYKVVRKSDGAWHFHAPDGHEIN